MIEDEEEEERLLCRIGRFRTHTHKPTKKEKQKRIKDWKPMDTSRSANGICRFDQPPFLPDWEPIRWPRTVPLRQRPGRSWQRPPNEERGGEKVLSFFLSSFAFVKKSGNKRRIQSTTLTLQPNGPRNDCLTWVCCVTHTHTHTHTHASNKIKMSRSLSNRNRELLRRAKKEKDGLAVDHSLCVHHRILRWLISLSFSFCLILFSKPWTVRQREVHVSAMHKTQYNRGKKNSKTR